MRTKNQCEWWPFEVQEQSSGSSYSVRLWSFTHSVSVYIIHCLYEILFHHRVYSQRSTSRFKSPKIPHPVPFTHDWPDGRQNFFHGESLSVLSLFLVNSVSTSEPDSGTGSLLVPDFTSKPDPGTGTWLVPDYTGMWNTFTSKPGVSVLYPYIFYPLSIPGYTFFVLFLLGFSLFT